MHCKTTTLVFCLALVVGLIGVAPAGAASAALLTTHVESLEAGDTWIEVAGRPLAVNLVSYTARADSDRVKVTWETAAGFGNAGFNLYRSTDPAGPQTLLAHVPSQAPGSTQGFAYSYEDLAVQAGQTYYYWLEDVSLSGATTLHGPVSAAVQGPTAVTLLSFTAEAQSNSVLVQWETASEVDNAAFHLLRSDTPDGEPILQAVIPSQAPGSIQGFAYTYEDLDVEPGQTYSYWLRDISLSGGSTLFGPVTVYFGGPTAVSLAGLDTSAGAQALPVAAAGLAALAGLALVGWVMARRQRQLS